MILYTMMPRELVYPEEAAEQQGASNQMLVQYQGVPVLAEQEDGMNYRIVRVMSTDPSHYLNEMCTPGTKISLS